MLAVIQMLCNMFMFVFKVLGCLLAPFFFMLIVFTVYYLIQGKRFPKKKFISTERYKPKPLVVRLFWELPKRFMLDRFEANPDAFPVSGFHLFAGEQGSGKSIATVEFILRYKKQFPNCKVRSNIELKFQDDKIENWKELIFNNNGVFGQIDFIDEVQNWFNSSESRDFPPEMIQDITQQRKQRKCIVGTSQVFTRVAKPIREQVMLLYKPLTVAGCFTVVRVYKAQIDDTGNVKKEFLRKVYCFVHDEELRNAYDTYERVERLSLKGFSPRSEQINNNHSSFLAIDKD